MKHKQQRPTQGGALSGCEVLDAPQSLLKINHLLIIEKAISA